MWHYNEFELKGSDEIKGSKGTKTLINRERKIESISEWVRENLVTILITPVLCLLKTPTRVFQSVRERKRESGFLEQIFFHILSSKENRRQSISGKKVHNCKADVGGKRSIIFPFRPIWEKLFWTSWNFHFSIKPMKVVKLLKEKASFSFRRDLRVLCVRWWKTKAEKSINSFVKKINHLVLLSEVENKKQKSIKSREQIMDLNSIWGRRKSLGFKLRKSASIKSEKRKKE